MPYEDEGKHWDDASSRKEMPTIHKNIEEKHRTVFHDKHQENKSI